MKGPCECSYKGCVCAGDCHLPVVKRMVLYNDHNAWAEELCLDCAEDARKHFNAEEDHE